MKNSNNDFEATFSYADSWKAINWRKIKRGVDKIQKRIYDAESNNQRRNVLIIAFRKICLSRMS